MKLQKQRDSINGKKEKTSKTRASQVTYLWEFENFIKERLRALGIIQ